MHCIYKKIRAILTFALGPFKPTNTEVTHDLCDFAAHIGLSAATVTEFTCAVEIRVVNDSGRECWRWFNGEWRVWFIATNKNSRAQKERGC
jgi:hypothetical protein